MWDCDGLIGKARTYFQRANDPAANDDAFALWLLLGLEFLLRAPLANVHPSLLADPRGDAIMSAAGYPDTSDPTELKSIQIKTVATRLRRVVEDFTEEREKDTTILTNLRNRELHTSDAILRSVDVHVWLPSFTRVVEVLCTHLGADPTDLVGDEVMRQGRALVDEEDKRLNHEIAKRVREAKEFLAKLSKAEVESRRTSTADQWDGNEVRDNCPACGLAIPLKIEPIRTTNERLDSDGVFALRDVISVARELRCPVCELQLNSTAEIKAAGLKQQHTRTDTENLADRYMDSFEPDDYGND